VRLLVDDMDLDGRDSILGVLDALPNFEVRIFNPFSRNMWRTPQFITRFGDVTRRMHNKSFTVDAQATVLGGRNIGDEYFEANPAITFSDLDVLGIGPVAVDVSRTFDTYWNHPLAYPLSSLLEQDPDAESIAKFRLEHRVFVASQADSDYIIALRESPLAQSLQAADLKLHWGEGEVVVDDPDKLISDRDQTELRLTDALRPYFVNLKKELTIFSPYFVPGKEGVEFFTSLVNQGVRVRILTNSLASTDVGIVHAGYARHRRALLQAGVELYETDHQLSREQRKSNRNWTGSSQASLHAKSFVIDRQHVFIGSLNLDPRSIVENSEVGVVIEVPELAEVMAQWFDTHIQDVAFKVTLETDENGVEQLRWTGQEDGKQVKYKVEPHTSIWQRIGIKLLWLLPIDSQL
jgi:putative cardiolipin synthase